MSYDYTGTEHATRYPPILDADDQARIEQQAMRWRVLNECWRQDALWRESTFFDQQIRESMPEPDTSRNPASHITSQLATLYDEAPVVTLADAQTALDAPELRLEVLWALSQERHYFCEGINDCLMRVDWINDGRLSEIGYRIVYPHMIHVPQAHPERPDMLVALEELRWGKVERDGKMVGQWIYEGWDLSDPAAPRRYDRHVDEYGNETALVELDWPEAYTDADGPILPYVLYHRRVSNTLFDCHSQKGLFGGTLTSAAFWTFWGMGVRDASYDVRAIIDGNIEGATTRGTDPRAAQGIVADPRLILQVTSKNDRQAQLASWKGSMDIKSTGEAIEQYMAGLALYAGLSPSDITLGSQAQSGYAIVVSREGQRNARKRQALPNRLGDRQVLTTAARLLNQNTTLALPTDPDAYQIQYAPIPESPAERAARISEVTTLLEAGLISPVDAYMRLNPGTDEEAAAEALLDIAQSRRLINMSAAAASTPTGEE